MPAEIEFKFILDISQYNRDAWMLKAFEQKWTVEDIHQCYIGLDSRLRRVKTVVSKGKKVKKKRNKHIFTFKRAGINCVFPIEIQKNISKDDFDVLSPTCERKLTKIRYKFNINHGEWAMDFLYDHDGSIYFALAEYECKSSMNTTYDVISDLKDMIIYTVVPGDKRFSNRMLSDIDYAKKLYQEIKEGLHEKNESEEVPLPNMVS